MLSATVADVARYDVGELSEAFLRGDLPRYDPMLSGLQAEGEQAPRLSWQLSDVHALGSIFMARREGVPMVQALRNARVWGKRRRPWRSPPIRSTRAGSPPCSSNAPRLMPKARARRRVMPG